MAVTEAIIKQARPTTCLALTSPHHFRSNHLLPSLSLRSERPTRRKPSTSRAGVPDTTKPATPCAASVPDSRY